MTGKGRSAALVLVVFLQMAFSLLPKPASAEDGDFKIALLGTGTPPPLMNRFGPATLVEADDDA